MSTAMLLKIFSDCCVCFAILGAFPAAFPNSAPLLLPALVCAVAAGLSTFISGKGMDRLSRSVALLTFPALSFAGNFSELLILLPVVIYTAAVILRGQLHLEYYSYRQFFLRSLMLLGVLYVVLSSLSVLEGIGGEDAGLIHAEVTLRYGLVHLICGIILQRQLRLGAENRAQGGAGQMAAVLGSTGIVVLGFLMAEPVLRRGATAVFNGLLSLVLGAVMAVLELFNTLLDEVELEIMNQQVQQHREDTPPAFIATVVPQIEQNIQNADDTRSMWWVALVLIILLAAMLMMILSFRKKGGEARSAETVAKVDSPRQEKKPPRGSNRARVRQLYRDFLRQEKKRGLSLKKDYTSRDILQRISSDTDGDAAARLREIYIRARYDDDCRISRQQVDAAKAALKKSRGA